MNKKDINSLLYQTSKLDYEEKIKVLFQLINSLSITDWNKYYIKTLDFDRNKEYSNKQKSVDTFNEFFTYIDMIKHTYYNKLLIQELNPIKNNTSEWLTNREVCSLLRISNSTLRNYRRDNKIEAYRMHGKLVYKKEDISKLVDANKIKGKTIFL